MGMETNKNIRVYDHDLSFLAMWACSTVHEHGIGAQHRHVKGSNGGLVVDERNMAAVYTANKWVTRRVGRTLRNSVVSIAELELNHIAHICDD